MMWDYLDAYEEETEEQLSRLEQLFLEMEKEPDQVETLNEIFRIVHTIKGSSATMGFGMVADFCHTLEDLFDKLRKGQLRVNDDLIDVLFKSYDTLKEMVSSAIKGENYSGDIEELTKTIDSFKQACTNDNTENPDNNRVKNNVWQISVEISDSCPMKNARALVIEKYIEEMGNVICMDPPFDALQKEEVVCERVTAVLESQMRIENVIWKLQSVQDVINVEVKQNPGKNKDAVRINISEPYKIEDIKRLKEALVRADIVELEFGEKYSMNLALLQLILAAYKENKKIYYKKNRGPVAKILDLMGILPSGTLDYSGAF
ncbi:two-component system, chemotaxis family, sensor kinase CheA [Caldanaerobius fijiensis DSM 17918]|uniref:Two-component system, chemotaxis family, sensor kinase CheA n=1 Tax=Caldanaerobius fijiensis DSM 17918 TaxID=1121256 RepID=A0A1M5ES58_9THEO|nr:Hpt domain-containing protein [Caldanaerobius fijiensis]SHF82143.1 two-component system, chemotaxis family, sensor kinase CheA [Caldanaerobius fijiensis DSM 17918]